MFVPNGVTRPEIKPADEISRLYGIEKDSYLLFLGRLVPEKGVAYLVEAYKQLQTDKKLVIAGGASDSSDYEAQLKELAAGDDHIGAVMIESNINSGNQKCDSRQNLKYGVSITDACVDWEGTLAILDTLAAGVQARRKRK